MPSKKHFIDVADDIRTSDLSKDERELLVDWFAAFFSRSAGRFDTQRFREACRPAEPVENNVPNLDCMESDDLMAFWSKYHRGSRADCAKLVGKRPGYTTIAAALAAYACNKAVAIDLRKSGAIQTAQNYETACQIAYNELPFDCRW